MYILLIYYLNLRVILRKDIIIKDNKSNRILIIHIVAKKL